MSGLIKIGMPGGLGGVAATRRRWAILSFVAFLLLIAAYYAYEASASTKSQESATGLVKARAQAVAKARAQARSKAVAVAAPKTLLSSGRVVESTQAADLFAPHSWYVPPPPPPPPMAQDLPPPGPTAPPLPYTFVGSYTPFGESSTYFLARGDRVIDAHVGDKLDGSLLVEKVEGGQIVFNYLPLNIRQTLPAGVVQ
jgi:hypothetical protein